MAAMIGVAFALTRDQSVLYALFSTLLFGLYGMLDDMLKLGKYQKLGLSLAIGLVSVLLVGASIMLLFPLLFLTIAIGNIFNLFAGFNGLEVGCTWMISLFFSIMCLITGNLMPFLLSAGFSIILFGFLMHNKYPAKIFPGNVGTMTMGGFFAGICLYYNVYNLLIPLLFLHIADVSLKGLSAGYFSSSEKRHTSINADEILVPGTDYLSLTRLILMFRPMTERQLVTFFWAATFILGVSSVIMTGVVL